MRTPSQDRLHHLQVWLIACGMARFLIPTGYVVSSAMKKSRTASGKPIGHQLALANQD
jgi:hypothetical protein